MNKPNVKITETAQLAGPGGCVMQSSIKNINVKIIETAQLAEPGGCVL